jgi:hypothetical protein
MKKIFYISAVTIALLISGCGEDRSQDDEFGLSSKGAKKQWITDSESAKVMRNNGFVYIPGGFDVDNDGQNEGGFWLSAYEAKEDDRINSDISLKNFDSVQALLIKHFKVFDPQDEYQRFNKDLTNESKFSTKLVRDITGVSAKKVMFTKDGNISKSSSPLEAVISLENSQIEDGEEIYLPSEKQWMQLVKLVVNNPKNWTEDEVGKGKLYQGNKYGISNRRYFVIENSILGVDEFVPTNHEVNVYDLSGSVAEWTSCMIEIGDRFLSGAEAEKEYNDVNNAPSWLKPMLQDGTTLNSIQGAGKYHDGFSKAGANDTLAINENNTTGNVSFYAVVARGGSNSVDDEMLVGIGASKLSYGAGYKGPTVGFRASSDYLY